MSKAQVQYIADEKGELQGVIVSIELWREILSERATAYLLKSKAMKQRLLEAKRRQQGIPFSEACRQLGI